MTFTGCGTMTSLTSMDYAGQSSGQCDYVDCVCILSACMRWVPAGPERIGSLLAPVRAVLARPCAQRVAISGPLGSRIVAAQRPLCCSV